MNFETIRKNYVKGLWNKQLVRVAVKKGLITKDDYEKIVGEKY